MKNKIVSILLLALVTFSCNQKSAEKQAEKTTKEEKNSELYSCPMHPEVTGLAGSECSECGMELTEKVVSAVPAKTEKTTEINQEPSVLVEKSTADKAIFPTDGIVVSYLKVKNALTKDDANGAAVAAKELLVTLNSSTSISSDIKLKDKYNTSLADAKSHVKHIADNAGKMEHQREYFSLLSKDVYDLIKSFGTKQKVYQDYCPMYGDGKTGYWISETKEVINPYYGSEMLNCGRRVGAVK